MKIALYAPKYTDVIVARVHRGFTAKIVACNDAHECAEALRKADILFVSGALYNGTVAEAVRQSPTLRWIQMLSSGTDVTARYGGVPSHIAITNAAEALGAVVAEHALALTLALVRALPAIEDAKRHAKWTRDALLPQISSLDGACVVIVGFGAAGRAIAVRAAAFGAQCLVVRRQQGLDGAPIAGATQVALDSALPRADVLIIAVPLTEETAQLIDRRRLALLRPHAKVINVARSGVIDTAALVEALASGRIASAALDVFDEEPLPAASELWRLPNLIVSPHIAGVGNARIADRMAEICVSNLRRFEAGELSVAA